jgi:hypothetical protein
MTIIHDNITLPPDGGAVIFAQLGGFTCSVCAPSTMGKEAVEAFATRELGEPMGGWEAIDKSTIGLGGWTASRIGCRQKNEGATARWESCGVLRRASAAAACFSTTRCGCQA